MGMRAYSKKDVMELYEFLDKLGFMDEQGIQIHNPDGRATRYNFKLKGKATVYFVGSREATTYLRGVADAAEAILGSLGRGGRV